MVHLESHGIARDKFPGIRIQPTLKAQDVIRQNLNVDILAARIKTRDAPMAAELESIIEAQLMRLHRALIGCIKLSGKELHRSIINRGTGLFTHFVFLF